MTTEQESTSAFIARWQGVTASEMSTSQSFVIELCELLGAPRPHATAEQEYMFERPVTFQHGDSRKRNLQELPLFAGKNAMALAAGAVMHDPIATAIKDSTERLVKALTSTNRRGTDELLDS